jgi:uncharacterized damage-inducible protein DinB
MKPHFAMMARYNAWANDRLYAEARAVSDESYRRDVGAFFRSLHGTLNHLLVTDRIWMRRFTGKGDHPSKLNAIMFDDLPSLEAARRAEDARIIQYVEGLSEEDIGGDFSYSTTRGVPQRFILRDLLAHWFNHQTHHRGQAHCILTVLGVPEPSHLISWQCIARCPRGIRQPVPNFRSNGRAASTCVIGHRRTPAVHHDVSRRDSGRISVILCLV